ncbi:MAG: LPS-assembly protein LptD [Rhodospirillaceae bacterium]|nr:LPS-assembly protein LptD [Rhodospirillaceae bacterium]
MARAAFKRIVGSLFGALALFSLAANEAAAQTTLPPMRTSIGNRAADQRPVVINANELIYNRERGTVTARGNVVIFQGDRVVLADEVLFDQRANRVTAIGNVALTEPGAPTVFASRADLSRDMKDGVLEQFRMLFPDDSKLAANGAIRIDGRRNEMSRVVFSPCRLCADDPTRAPLWQIKARRVVHDQESRDIRYSDAVMEIFGLPVFYTPYFSHPDPTVRRKTGFLTPVIGSEARLGQTLRVPYFIVIDRDKDATITPLITTRQRAALFGEYRQRFPGGALVTSGSITYVQRTDNFDQPQSGDELRGHIFGRARYDIDRHWRTGADLGWVSDKTYLRRYNVYNQDTLISRAFAEGFYDRDYARVRGFHFRTLRQNEEQEGLPYVLPYAEYQAYGTPYGRWGRWQFDTSVMALGRTKGVESRRLSLSGSWRLPYTDPAGWQLTTTASLNADLFWVNNNEAGLLPTFSGTVGRIYPQLKLDWRYPFVRELGNVRHVVEPRVAIVATPPGLNTWRIPNEDSQDLELDELSLFDANRYPGHDRIDDGVRVVYGIENALYGNRGGKAEAFIGQSWRIFGEENVLQNSGIRNNLSDIVGRIRISPASYFNFTYRFRMNAKDLDFRRQEVAISGGIPALRAAVAYIDLSDQIGNSEFATRRQIRFSASSQITPNWLISGGAVFDLVNSRRQPQAFALSVRYQNECCTATVVYSRTVELLSDAQPSNRFLISIIFKYLGEIRHGT